MSKHFITYRSSKNSFTCKVDGKEINKHNKDMFMRVVYKMFDEKKPFECRGGSLYYQGLIEIKENDEKKRTN